MTPESPGSEFKIVGKSAVKETVKSPPVNQLVFTLAIERRGLFHYYAVVLPVLMASILPLLAYYIPPRSNSRLLICKYSSDRLYRYIYDNCRFFRQCRAAI